MGTGAGFSRNTAPFARGTNPDSWDGSTIADDSFLSLKHASAAYGVVSGNISPSIVQTHQTPPAIESSMHRWEEAEVVSPDGSEMYDSSKPKHPYAIASPVIVRDPSSNPFLDQNPFEDNPNSAFLKTQALNLLSLHRSARIQTTALAIFRQRYSSRASRKCPRLPYRCT